MSDPSAEIRPREPRVGDVVGGKYQVIRRIGVGGMGTVYEAKNVELGRLLALKFLQPRLADNPDVVERFLREARASATIDHPCVIYVFDVGWTDDGLPYFAMELLDGLTLTGELRRGPMAIDRAVAVVSRMLEALQAAHGRSIAHRDLKPDNVFLVQRGGAEEGVKVLDFGISKFLGSGGTNLTHTGSILGTPSYMSPEQARGSRDVDHRTDIWSAGAILYELCTGQPPYDGDTYNEVIVKIATEPPPPVAALRPGVHPSLVAVIDRAMARSLADRYPSAAAMREALAEVVAVAGTAPGVGSLRAALPAASTTALTSTPAAWEVTRLETPHPTPRPAAGRPRSYFAIALVLTLAVVGLGGTALWFFLSGPTEPPPVLAAQPGIDPVPRPAAPVPAAVPPAAPAIDPMPRPAAPAPAAVPPRSSACAFRILLLTPNASARLDGLAVAGPSIEVPAPCGTKRRLAIEASGHRPATIEVEAALGQTVQVELERAPAPHAAAAMQPAARSEARPVPPPPAPPAVEPAPPAAPPPSRSPPARPRPPELLEPNPF